MTVAASPPMTSMSAQEAVDFIVDRQLVSSEVLDELKAHLCQLPSGDEVIDELIQRGKMTAYQKEQVLSGQGDRLCFGPYRLLSPLGEGGMGEVFKAWQPRLDRLIALKFILPEYLDSQSLALNRFQREARAIAKLQHPNIIILYDADEIDGIPFIAMEYVDGVSLVDMVRKSGPLSIKRACDYMRQAALGLQHAFEHGFVHRDIKPSNMMVSQSKKKTAAPAAAARDKSLVTMHDLKRLSERDGSWGADRLKILDMGLARLNKSMTRSGTAATPLTVMGAVVGTPDYVAPEQARDSSKVDIRADLYSLGCTFYFILSGQVPFPGGTAIEKMIKHQCDEATPLRTLRRDVPQQIVNIVERLMAKDPKDRFQKPAEVADAISKYLADPNPSAGSTPGSGSVPGDTVLGNGSEGSGSKVGSGSRGPLAETRAQSVVVLAPGGSPKPGIPGLCETMASVEIETTDNKEVFWESVAVLALKRVRKAKIKPLATLTGHLGAISGVSVSPNGRLAATADVHGAMRIWDIHDPHPHEIDRRFHKSEIQAIALPPDNSKHLVFGEVRQGKVVLCRLNWRVDSLVDLVDLSSLGQKYIGCLNFTADGEMLAAGVGSLAVLWNVVNDTATNRKVLRGLDQPIQAIALSPDRTLLAAAGQDKALYFWNLGVGNWTGKAVRVKTQIAAINTIRFSPDGSVLALAGLDNRIVLWPMCGRPDESVRILRGHTSNVQHIQFIDNGKQLASVGTDGQVLYWDIHKRSIVRECSLELSLAYRMEMSADGSRLVAGFTNGSVGVYCPSESD